MHQVEGLKPLDRRVVEAAAAAPNLQGSIETVNRLSGLAATALEDGSCYSPLRILVPENHVNCLLNGLANRNSVIVEDPYMSALSCRIFTC